jgi:hypothetical protein
MKKYDKIMSVFTTAIAGLEALEKTNITKACTLQAKEEEFAVKAADKINRLHTAARELYDEGAAAVKTIKKIKELLS